jgi:N-acetylglucosaminyl-diphospho-decaprenol L-rhamnosyltransferase
MSDRSMSDRPSWSLITVTHNSGLALRQYWSSPPRDVEWIVVDNDSKDDTVEVARSLGARVIPLDSNIGFGAANNVGFYEARGELIGFLNPDVSADFTSLPQIAAVVNENDWLVAPQLLNSDGTQQPNGRGFPLAINKLKNRSGKSNELRDQYLLYADRGQTRKVCWFIGAAVLGRKSTFKRIDVWDDRYFIYYEDSDICLRAWAAGLECVVLGDVNWVHGWARETTKFSWSPWKRELASMTKFYSR